VYKCATETMDHSNTVSRSASIPAECLNLNVTPASIPAIQLCIDTLEDMKRNVRTATSSHTLIDTLGQLALDVLITIGHVLWKVIVFFGYFLLENCYVGILGAMGWVCSRMLVPRAREKFMASKAEPITVVAASNEGDQSDEACTPDAQEETEKAIIPSDIQPSRSDKIAVGICVGSPPLLHLCLLVLLYTGSWGVESFDHDSFAMNATNSVLLAIVLLLPVVLLIGAIELLWYWMTAWRRAGHAIPAGKVEDGEA